MKWKIAVLCLALLGAYVAAGCSTNRAEKSAIVDDGRVRYLLRAIKQAAADDHYQSKRENAKGTHWSIIERRGANQATYLRCRLIAEGKVNLKHLQTIAEDQSIDQSYRAYATMLVAQFDTEWAFKQFLKASVSDRSTNIYFDLKEFVPLDTAIALLDKTEIIRVLGEKLKSQRFSEFILTQFDALVFPDQWGTPLGDNDPRLIAWFNRRNDQDIDSILRERAPKALHFRNRAIAEGYDPLVAFPELVTALRNNELELAVSRIYSDPHDRAACSELFIQIFGDGRNPGVMGPAGWKDRFNEWYSKNRRRFVYDQNHKRFVVS